MSAVADLREALGEVIGLIDEGEPTLARRRALLALRQCPSGHLCFWRDCQREGIIGGFCHDHAIAAGHTPCQRCFGLVEDGTCTCDEEVL